MREIHDKLVTGGRVVSFGVSKSFRCFSSLLQSSFIVMDKASRGLIDLTLRAVKFILLLYFALRSHVMPTPSLVPRSAFIVFVFKRNIQHPLLPNQQHQNKGVVSFSFSSLLALKQTETHNCCFKSEEHLCTSRSLPLCSRAKTV